MVVLPEQTDTTVSAITENAMSKAVSMRVESANRLKAAPVFSVWVSR